MTDERCQRVLEEVEYAESLVGEAVQRPRGRLRVDLQAGLAAALVFPDAYSQLRFTMSPW